MILPHVSPDSIDTTVEVMNDVKQLGSDIAATLLLQPEEGVVMTVNGPRNETQLGFLISNMVRAHLKRVRDLRGGNTNGVGNG